MPRGVYKRTEATRQKIRLSLLGKPGRNLGKSWKIKDTSKMNLDKIGKTRTNHWLIGEKSHFWKGGVSRAYKTGYYSIEYKQWRKSVFERDGYACRVCGAMGYITAHHIKSFAHFPDLRFELTNGITLCEPCHSETDNYKGRNIKK